MGTAGPKEETMAIELERPTLSREEFKALQDPEDGDIRGYEYEDGRLIPVPPVHGPQSSAWGDLYGELYQHVEQNSLGRVWIDLAVYLDPKGRRRYFPDIAFLANDVLDRYDSEVIVGAPTLVVEVSAESSRQRDSDTKLKAYHQAGVPWYWIADVTIRQIFEYRWTPERYELVSQVSFDGPFRPQLFLGLTLSGIRS
jgi:Uma2 family endonuclease